MTTQESISTYFDAIVKDMGSQNQKVPVDKFRIVATDKGGQLFAPDWFKYMITGRGPGKMPPLDRIADWVDKYIGTPVRENKDGTFSVLASTSLAYAIGVKIAREGTDVWQGKKKGVDLLGAMEKNMPDLLADLLASELLKIQTSLHQKI